MKECLLTFMGNRDPFSEGKNEITSDGPILTLLDVVNAKNIKFTKIIIFPTKMTEDNAKPLKETIEKRFKGIQLDIRETYENDPISYIKIIAYLREQLPKIMSENPDTNFTVFLAPGTPQTHAVWFFMAASREYNLNLINIPHPKFDSPKANGIKKILLETPGFPKLRTDFGYSLQKAEDTGDLEAALKKVGLNAESKEMKGIINLAAANAKIDYPVLILGESGTGKELLAKLIHQLSPSPESSFVDINCSALPETLIESELFGYKKGTFTGANADKTGLIEQANGGTLFLDEIGDVPLLTQVKLLRVLNDGIVRKIGAGQGESVAVNFRLICATNRDLYKMMDDGTFREDLYFRISLLVLNVPPLRQRTDDIEPIAKDILTREVERLNIQIDSALEPQVLSKLLNYDWPGNVRQLDNVIKRSIISTVQNKRDTIKGEDIIFDQKTTQDSVSVPTPYIGFSMQEYKDKVTTILMEKALQMSNGKQAAAAKLLGCSNQNVSQYLKKKQNVSSDKP